MTSRLELEQLLADIIDNRLAHAHTRKDRFWRGIVTACDYLSIPMRIRVDGNAEFWPWMGPPIPRVNDDVWLFSPGGKPAVGLGVAQPGTVGTVNGIVDTPILGPPMCVVKATADQTGIIANNFTLVALDTIVTDTDGMGSTSGDKIDITVPGFYVCTAKVRWLADSTGQRDLYILRNANTSDRLARDTMQATSAGSVGKALSSEPVYLDSGTDVQAYVTHTATSNRTLNHANAFGEPGVLAVEWVAS